MRRFIFVALFSLVVSACSAAGNTFISSSSATPLPAPQFSYSGGSFTASGFGNTSFTQPFDMPRGTYNFVAEVTPDAESNQPGRPMLLSVWLLPIKPSNECMEQGLYQEDLESRTTANEVREFKIFDDATPTCKIVLKVDTTRPIAWKLTVGPLS